MERLKDEGIDQAVEVLWNYLRIDGVLQISDVIFLFGGVNRCVPKHAAELYRQGLAPVVVLSGAMGNSAAKVFGMSECDAFYEELVKEGVPSQSLILEREATNTGENILFGMKAIRERGIDPKRVIFVSTPHHSRRCLATFRRHEPMLEVISSPPSGFFDDFIVFTKERLALKLVGEIDRLLKYSEEGLITFNEKISQEIMDSAEMVRRHFHI